MIKETPLYECHLKHNAKIVDFAGWHMPVEYAGLMKEHLCVRSTVGLFDVSHMGEIEIKGNSAIDFLQKVTSNNVAALKNGRIQYSLLCYRDGGIVDDILVHRFSEKHFFLCVNASNTEKDLSWLQENSTGDVLINDISGSFAQLAIQGPDSQKLLQTLTGIDLSSMSRYFFTEGEIAGVKNVIIARTGYTGEDGFELYLATDSALSAWDAILEAGKAYGIMPCGLGARDTLRLEVRYPLYGNDIDKTTTPYEAGLGWVVSKKKGDFIGRDAIFKIKEKGLPRKLVGAGMLDRGIPRKGYEVYDMEGNMAGEITSGTYSPSLKKPIALAYVKKELSGVDTPLLIKIRNKMMKSIVIKTPFITGTSLDNFMKKRV